MSSVRLRDRVPDTERSWPITREQSECPAAHFEKSKRQLTQV